MSLKLAARLRQFEEKAIWARNGELHGMDTVCSCHGVRHLHLQCHFVDRCRHSPSTSFIEEYSKFVDLGVLLQQAHLGRATHRIASMFSTRLDFQVRIQYSQLVLLMTLGYFFTTGPPVPRSPPEQEPLLHPLQP